MNARRVAVVLCLLVLPVFSWFFLVFSPAILLLGLIATGLVVGGRRAFLAMRRLFHSRWPGGHEERSELNALARKIHLSQTWATQLNDLLSEHLKSHKSPIRACACVNNVNGITTLVARFVTLGGAYSHSVRGTTPEDASARLSWKLRSERLRAQSGNQVDNCGFKKEGGCGFYSCAGYARCPRRTQGASAYQEVAWVPATV